MSYHRYEDLKWQSKIRPYINQMYGSWIIIDDSFQQKLSQGRKIGRLCHVRCTCGFESYRELNQIVSGRSNSCDICKAKKRLQLVDGIPTPYFNYLKRESTKRKLVFEVSQDHLGRLFTQQQSSCALSGVRIYFEEGPFRRKGRSSGQTASLDRIDSTKGYLEGNVQWVHKDVNQMKSNRTDEEFILWCKTIANFNLK